MMKKYLITLAAFLCCAMMTTLFTSCSNDDDKENDKGNVYNYALTVANEDYDVTVLFDGLHSVITEVKNAPTWLTITPQTAFNSDGTSGIIIKVQATDDGAERKCTLHLTTASNEQAVLTVTQTKSDSDDENGNDISSRSHKTGPIRLLH